MASSLVCFLEDEEEGKMTPGQAALSLPMDGFAAPDTLALSVLDTISQATRHLHKNNTLKQLRNFM